MSRIAVPVTGFRVFEVAAFLAAKADAAIAADDKRRPYDACSLWLPTRRSNA